MIEARKIVDSLRKCADNGVHGCPNCAFNNMVRCTVYLMKDAANHIEHLSVEQDALALEIEKLRKELEAAKSAWISVDERLPEVGIRKYIVVIPHPDGMIIDFARYLDDGWAPVSWANRQLKITHWQPLPEPPKEGVSDYC